MQIYTVSRIFFSSILFVASLSAMTPQDPGQTPGNPAESYQQSPTPHEIPSQHNSHATENRESSEHSVAAQALSPITETPVNSGAYHVGVSSLIRNNPRAAVAFAAPAAAIIAYKKNEKFRAYIDDRSGNAKRFMIRSVALPVAMKVEEIRSDGLSRYDVLKIGLFGLGCYALKKVGDYFCLWSSIKARDFTKTRESTRSFFKTLYAHKGKILAATLGSLSVFWLWKFSQAVNKQVNSSLIDDFFLTLTNEQRIEIMQSNDLAQLVANAADDPLPLQHHELFMSLLSDAQKKKLSEAIEDYIKHNVPLAFLEDDLN